MGQLIVCIRVFDYVYCLYGSFKIFVWSRVVLLKMSVLIMYWSRPTKNKGNGFFDWWCLVFIICLAEKLISSNTARMLVINVDGWRFLIITLNIFSDWSCLVWLFFLRRYIYFLGLLWTIKCIDVHLHVNILGRFNFVNYFSRS